MADLDIKKIYRAVLHGSFTRCVTELEGYLSQSEPDLSVIKVTWEMLQEKMVELKTVSGKVFDLLMEQDASERDLTADLDSCDVYTKRFKTINLKCQKSFAENDPMEDSKSSINLPSNRSNAAGSLVQENRQPEVLGKRIFQLPIIQFKKFDGSVRDFLSFWAQFCKVHDSLDLDIDSADRVDYLIQATIPGSRARQLVESFPATGENYPKIIESLKSRFGREDLQIEVYIRELLKLILSNAVSKGKVELSRLYDQIETHLRSLETLGITSDKFAAMLFPLIESCLPEELLRIWQRSSVSLCSDMFTRDNVPVLDHNRDSNAGKILLDNRLKALMHFLRCEVENKQRVCLAAEGFGLHDVSRSPGSLNSKRKFSKSNDVSLIPTAADLVNNEAKEENLFRNPFKWLAFFKETSFDELVNKTLISLPILVDSNFLLAEERTNDEVYLRKIFKKAMEETTFEMEDIGLWEERSWDFSTKRHNLGIILRTCIVVTHNNTLNHLTDRRDKHIDSITKVNYVVLLVLASIYNITLHFSIRDTWGYNYNNTEWTGMMGELVRKEADIGGTSLFVLKERVDLIDYIGMISPTRAKFVFRQPKLSSISNVYVLPFDSKVWISSVILVLLMGLALFAVMRWELTRNKLLELNTEKSDVVEGSILDVALVTFGAVCQQSAASVPYSVPGRIVTLFLFVSLMFIYVSYSANIVALLQTSSTSIKTLSDLLTSRVSVGVDDTVYNRFFFSTADEPVRRSLYRVKIAPSGKPSNYMPIEEGVRRMRQGLFAFHMETGAGYKLVGETFKEDEKCGLQEISYLQVVDPWLAIQKNSSYKELLKIGLRLLQENGIQQRENKLIYTPKPICNSKSSTFFSVGIVDCYPAALLLAGGMIFAFVIFVTEIYLKSRQKDVG